MRMVIPHLPKQIRIATRRSRLAIIQANMTKDALDHWCKTHNQHCEVSLLPLQTTGDARKEAKLEDIGGKGVFTKEIEEALLNGDAEIAMHSLKDVPAIMPTGLILAGALPREDYCDALIYKHRLTSLDDLPQGAVIGTSSPRRGAQILRNRKDLHITPFRGNVPTRIQKLHDGEIDATLLAVAGLRRLQMAEHISLILTPEQMLPAIGQGIVALQCREDATAIVTLLQNITHDPTWHQLRAERAMLEVIEGDCRSPIAGLARIKGQRVSMEGLIISEDGQTQQYEVIEGSLNEAAECGTEVGRRLQKHLSRVWS